MTITFPDYTKTGQQAIILLLKLPETDSSNNFNLFCDLLFLLNNFNFTSFEILKGMAIEIATPHLLNLELITEYEKEMRLREIANILAY